MWIVPTVIEREGAHERVYDLYSCLLKERIVLLSGEIDDQLSSSICAQLLYLSGLSSEAIIYISIQRAAASVPDWLFMTSCSTFPMRSLPLIWGCAPAWQPCC